MRQGVGRSVVQMWPVLLGFLLLASSCEPPPQYHRAEMAAGRPQALRAGAVPASLPLRATVRIGGAEAPAMAMGLATIGDFVVIADRSSNPHIRVLSLRDGAVRSRALEHGDGPMEVMDVSQLEVQRVRGDTAWLSGADLPARRGFELLLRPDGVLGSLRVDSITHPVPNGVLQRFLTPSGALLFGAMTRALLVRIDTARRRVEFLDGMLPHDATAFPTARGLADANWRRAARRPSTGEIAVAYEHAARLDLFDPAGRWRRTVVTPRAPTLAFQLDPSNQAVIWQARDQLGFVDIAAADSLIFALYCGCGHRALGARLIQVYRWDGTFVREYQVDHLVYKIAVPPDARRLVGVTLVPEPVVVAWDLTQPAAVGGAPRVAAR